MPGIKVPPALMKQFVSNFRLTGDSPIGTRQVDIAALRRAVEATLANRTAVETIVNQAMKSAQIKMK